MRCFLVVASVNAEKCHHLFHTLAVNETFNMVGGRCNHQKGSKGLNEECALFMRSSDQPSHSTCLSVNQQPRSGRRLSSCPWSARSSLMWYGRVTLDLSNGNHSPFLRNACTRLLN